MEKRGGIGEGEDRYGERTCGESERAWRRKERA